MFNLDEAKLLALYNNTDHHNPYHTVYYYTSSDQRNHIQLRARYGRRTSMSLARALMQVKLNEILPRHMEVDHKDDDKMNDVIDNLQILTGEENRRKHNSKLSKTYIELKCDNCGKVFTRLKSKHTDSVKRNRGNVSCSYSCSGFIRKSIKTKKEN